MQSIVANTQTIVEAFSLAAKAKDHGSLDKLLSDKGTFDIQDENLDTIEVGKRQFLNWFTRKLSTTAIHTICYDTCLHCAIGNTVVLFNNGQFPRTIKGSFERSKTGVMFRVEDGKIITLKFCFVFAEKDNPYVIDCLKAKK